MTNPLTVFGIPVLGIILPRIGKRRLALNRDGSYVDTGEFNISDEVGFYWIELWTFEWLNLGIPLTGGHVHLTSTGEIVDPDFEVAGG